RRYRAGAGPGHPPRGGRPAGAGGGPARAGVRRPDRHRRSGRGRSARAGPGSGACRARPAHRPACPRRPGTGPADPPRPRRRLDVGPLVAAPAPRSGARGGGGDGSRRIPAVVPRQGGVPAIRCRGPPDGDRGGPAGRRPHGRAPPRRPGRRSRAPHDRGAARGAAGRRRRLAHPRRGDGEHGRPRPGPLRRPHRRARRPDLHRAGQRRGSRPGRPRTGECGCRAAGRGAPAGAARLRSPPRARRRRGPTLVRRPGCPAHDPRSLGGRAGGRRPVPGRSARLDRRHDRVGEVRAPADADRRSGAPPPAGALHVPAGRLQGRRRLRRGGPPAPHGRDAHRSGRLDDRTGAALPVRGAVPSGGAAGRARCRRPGRAAPGGRTGAPGHRRRRVRHAGRGAARLRARADRDRPARSLAGDPPRPGHATARRRGLPRDPRQLHPAHLPPHHRRGRFPRRP
ncbi:MAG: FtsK/SpoIIIE family protein, partial [uncultured Pseudonocardia sp.]